MADDVGLDRDRIERLMGDILLPIRANYLRGPISRDRVYEALNALAAVTAITLAGTKDEDAYDFFATALNNHMENWDQQGSDRN
jgi:hypothetical protein